MEWVLISIYLQFDCIEEMVVIPKLVFPGPSILIPPWLNSWLHGAASLCTFSRYGICFSLLTWFSSCKSLLNDVPQNVGSSSPICQCSSHSKAGCPLSAFSLPAEALSCIVAIGKELNTFGQMRHFTSVLLLL